MFSFSGYCQKAIQGGCTSVYSVQQCVGVFISSHPHEQLDRLVFSVTAVGGCVVISHYGFDFPDD